MMRLCCLLLIVTAFGCSKSGGSGGSGDAGKPAGAGADQPITDEEARRAITDFLVRYTTKKDVVITSMSERIEWSPEYKAKHNGDGKGDGATCGGLS